MRFNLGKIGHDFLVFDDVKLSDHFVVRTLDMPLLPTLDANIIEVDGKPGAWFSSLKIGTRDINVGLGILMDTRDRKDIIKAWIDLSDKLAKDKVCKLEIGNGYYVNAMLVGDSETETNGKWSIVNVAFRCFDPYIYGKEHDIALKQGDNKIYVNGKVATYPYIEISGATTTTVTNKNTDEKIRVEKIPSGKKLEIDMENHGCRCNGVYMAADPTISDFWPITPGEVTINVSSGTGTLKYKEVYL